MKYIAFPENDSERERTIIMIKKKAVLILACTMMMGLGACGMGGADAANTSESTAGGASQKSEDGQASDAESVYDASSDGRPVMKIRISEEIPAADSDGEIPGADGTPDTKRDTVTFGNFYQDTDGKKMTPVKWIVLDEQNGYSLLMTDQIIASKGWMEKENKGSTWAETDLRRWLDQDFYNAAFSDEEKSHMALFDAVQPQNPRYKTPAGKATVDPVSLLSYQELIRYMPTDGERKTKPTDYAIEEGCYQNPDGDAAWWLRSPGPEANIPEHLASGGNLGARTHYIDDSTIGVRPVIWVESGYISGNR